MLKFLAAACLVQVAVAQETVADAPLAPVGEESMMDIRRRERDLKKKVFRGISGQGEPVSADDYQEWTQLNEIVNAATKPTERSMFGKIFCTAWSVFCCPVNMAVKCFASYWTAFVVQWCFQPDCFDAQYKGYATRAKSVMQYAIYTAHEIEYAPRNPILNCICPRTCMEFVYGKEALPEYLGDYGMQHLTCAQKMRYAAETVIRSVVGAIVGSFMIAGAMVYCGVKPAMICQKGGCKSTAPTDSGSYVDAAWKTGGDAVESVKEMGSTLYDKAPAPMQRFMSSKKDEWQKDLELKYEVMKDLEYKYQMSNTTAGKIYVQHQIDSTKGELDEMLADAGSQAGEWRDWVEFQAGVITEAEFKQRAEDRETEKFWKYWMQMLRYAAVAVCAFFLAVAFIFVMQKCTAKVDVVECPKSPNTIKATYDALKAADHSMSTQIAEESSDVDSLYV
jgi:hypothetical protein